MSADALGMRAVLRAVKQESPRIRVSGFASNNAPIHDVPTQTTKWPSSAARGRLDLLF